jgi:hypothetical protein
MRGSGAVAPVKRELLELLRRNVAQGAVGPDARGGLKKRHPQNPAAATKQLLRQKMSVQKEMVVDQRLEAAVAPSMGPTLVT